MSQCLLKRWLLALVACNVVLCAARRAGAQSSDSPEAADTAASASRVTTERRAVSVGHAALELYEASRWDDAYERFKAAEALVHSPVFVLYMARCRRNGGKLLEARQLFERVSAERVSEQAPPAWHGAVADASAELMALRRSIPRVIIILRGEWNSEPSLSIDGREVALVSLGKPIELDPGRHWILARDAQGRRALRGVELVAGQAASTIELRLEPLANQSAAASPPGDSGTAFRTTGFVLLGVSAVGLSVGVGTAIAAANQDKDADAERWARWSIAGFIAGGFAAGAGVLFLILSPSQTRARAGDVTQAAIRVGISEFAIVGSF
jgi:hypothetical protein